jgi:N-glycosidase YbiA
MKWMDHYNPREATVVVDGDERPCIYFYGGPFSNFVGGPFVVNYPQPWFESDGLSTSWYSALYPTIEHFYQASKAISQHDHRVIREADHPGIAKRLGNAERSWAPGCASLPLLRDDWEDVKYRVMLNGLQAKFYSDHFGHYLLETGDAYIAEDSPSDYIWGIRDAEGGFTGQNLLGKALMEVRKELRGL